MEVKKAPFIPYSEKQFYEYKLRLTDALLKDALDCEQIANNADAKMFIANYVEQEITNETKEMSLKLQGISMKFAHMDIQIAEKNVRTYPIINEYIGHHVMKSYYFYIEKTTSLLKVGCVEVNQSSIIVI